MPLAELLRRVQHALREQAREAAEAPTAQQVPQAGRLRPSPRGPAPAPASASTWWTSCTSRPPVRPRPASPPSRAPAPAAQHAPVDQHGADAGSVGGVDERLHGIVRRHPLWSHPYHGLVAVAGFPYSSPAPRGGSAVAARSPSRPVAGVYQALPEALEQIGATLHRPARRVASQIVRMPSDLLGITPGAGTFHRAIQ